MRLRFQGWRRQCVTAGRTAGISRALARLSRGRGLVPPPGAAVVHVHARGPDGKNSGEPAIYAEIIRQIRARSPILSIATPYGVTDANASPFIAAYDADPGRPGIQSFAERQVSFGRLSMTRLALPIERSMVPMRTSALTPT